LLVLFAMEGSDASRGGLERTPLGLWQRDQRRIHLRLGNSAGLWRQTHAIELVRVGKERPITLPSDFP